MKRHRLYWPLVLFVLIAATAAWSADPEIQNVSVDRGRDVHGDWGGVDWYEAVWVWVYDADGADDIESVTITDSEGNPHLILPDSDSGVQYPAWFEEDATTVRVYWGEWGTPDPPPAGTYAVLVEDMTSGTDSLVTPLAPEVSPLSPELLSPTPEDLLIYETVPTFTWMGGPPGAVNFVTVFEPDDGPTLWYYDAGSGTSVVYNEDGLATQSELTPGRRYLWSVSARVEHDCGVSDPRVCVSTIQHSYWEIIVYSPTPTITDVWVCSGRDTDAPDWPEYHRRAWVRVTDCDGAGDITSITITDDNGVDHVKTPGCGCWWQDDDYTISASWCESDLLSAPGGASYTVAVTDASSNSDSVTTAVVPVASDVHPELVSPVMDSVIYDTAPTFSWNAGGPGSSYAIHLEEEGTGGDIWYESLGEPTDSVIEIPYPGELEPNHSYFWTIDSWWPDDVRVSDSRVEIWTTQATRGRFTMYGDWPELPPTLSGKLAHEAIRWADESGAWLNSAIGYTADPTTRSWLGPTPSGSPYWSPDGSKLLLTIPSAPWSIWIDPLDGSDPVPIPGVVAWRCDWGPDSERVVYETAGSDDWFSDIWVSAVDGSYRYPLTESPDTWDRYPHWSPDGLWIVYRKLPRSDPSDFGTHLVRYDGTDDHALIATGLAGAAYEGYEISYMGDPAWSPDGSELAVDFSALRPGGDPNNDDDYIGGVGRISRDGGLITPVFISPPYYYCCAGAGLPWWSPDGTQIGFESAHHMAPDPEWLPGPGEDYGKFELGGELWLINADGSGEPTRLTYDQSFHHQASWWAPNTSSGLGQSVTIGNVTVTYSEVVAEGSTSIVVTEDLPAPPPGDLTFVQDFTYHLATTATVTGAVTVTVDYTETAYPPVLGERLSVLLWDGDEWVDITTGRDTAAYTITGEFLPGVASDWYLALALDRPGIPEVKVMFDACTEGQPSGPGFFVAEADFSHPVRLTSPALGPALLPECVCSCGTVASALSPQGDRVVMERVHATTLEVMELTALLETPEQEPQPLTDEYEEPVIGSMPSWSPSGDQIVYVSWGEFGIAGIAAVNADGTNQHMLYSFPGPDYPPTARWVEWSPDGSRILFQAGEVPHGGCHLYVLEHLDDPGGATLRQLTADEAYAEDQPHWSPDGRYLVFARSPYGTIVWRGSDIWLMDVVTGVARQVTDSPEIGKAAHGWCPYDGYIYFWDNVLGTEKRVLPDGSGEETLAYWGDHSGPGERASWLPTGLWLDALNALPGEAVTAKLGIADAEDLAGVQAQVRYAGDADTVSVDSVELSDRIADWMLPTPSIGAEVASFFAAAVSDPGSQSVDGAAHLFDLDLTNSPTAAPGEVQYLSFDSLTLSDSWGDPFARISFSGGVRTIPCAYLEVATVTGPVCADLEDPVPFTVTVTALDREGWTMEADALVELQGFDREWWPYLLADAVSPSSVAVADGVWSGEVTLSEPRESVQLLAHWNDIGGYSNAFLAVGKGDPSGDSETNIFDVVRVANMAIDRGTWEAWQWWAADLNRDDEVNIFDVVMCANDAMAAMEALGGRWPVRAAIAPADQVLVSWEVEWTDTQAIVTFQLSDGAGLAGLQVELEYDPRKLSYAGVAAGELLEGTNWSVLSNDLGGRVKAIAYTASAAVLPGGEGTILTFTFTPTGKGKPKVEVTSVALTDVEGNEIESHPSHGRGGGKTK